MRLIECVPNISEGRDRTVIDRCAAAITAGEGVRLLDVDPGADTNRTVITFAGEPEAVLAACHRLFEAAEATIDMSRHRGSHARQAAVDVCPFIPLEGVTMAECVALARRFGAELGEKGHSVYLYEEAAHRPERRNLADLRQGEYEALPDKLARPEWEPDFGPAAFTGKVRRFGAPIVGAREFLIAWNLNINSDEKKIAHRIALDIREKGRARRDETGQLLRPGGDLSFEAVATSLESVKSVGWVIETEKYGPVAQVSINLCNFRKTPMWKVFETAREVARKRGVVVTGAEIVGLVPREAILESGRYYRERMGTTRGASESELIRTAVQSMGLSDLHPFEPDRKIVELCLRPPAPLAGMTVRGFCEETASASPAPGGGSVAALAGALSASLSAMVTRLTFGRKGFEDQNPAMEEVGVRAHGLKERLLEAIDADTRAFNAVMAAGRMPRATLDQARLRDEAMGRAALEATRVPFSVVEVCEELVEIAATVVARGNPGSVSDGGVAALAAHTACLGGWYNVLINLPGIPDPALREDFLVRGRAMVVRVEESAARVRDRVLQAVSGPAAGPA